MYKELEILRIGATYLLYVLSVSEDFAVFVRQLVRAGLEHLGDDIWAFPRW